MFFTFFGWLSVPLQQGKKPHSYSCLMINCNRLDNGKGPGFRTHSSKSCKVFPKNIIDDGSWPNDLQFRRYIGKWVLSCINTHNDMKT